MPKSKDLIEETRKQHAQAMAEAMMAGDKDKFDAAMKNFCDGMAEAVVQNARELAAEGAQDATVLAARGVRQLTAAEMNYYTGLASCMKAADPKMALTNWDVTMPQTIIDSALEGIRKNHPLLDRLNMVNTSYLTKWIYNAQGKQAAAWGPITGKITQELSGAFRVVDVTLLKLTAWMPVSLDLLELGPNYLDQYVRATLFEAAAVAMEEGFVSGDGKDKPIGMTRDVSTTANVVGGVYPEMTAVELSELTSEALGPIVAKLARTPGDPDTARAVTDLLFVANPFDYWEKIFPATSYRRPDGSYVRDVLPIPADIIQSVGLARGKAVIGIPSRYFVGLGVHGRNGDITTDEGGQFFLDDARAYKIKIQANALPMDEYAFVLLDISKLKPSVLKVNNIGK